MKIMYIGHYEPGSTSRMRGEYLRKILQPEKFIVADISRPIEATNKVFRSIGWRFYKGPLISKINQYCTGLLSQEKAIDLAWIDKAVFIKPDVVKSLKKVAKTLIHYTPDTAFMFNRSALFYKGLTEYDYCITTKSFEIDAYNKAGAKKVIYCTQGFDPLIHKANKEINNKAGVAFAGLGEAYREEVIAALLNAGVTVKLAGVNWENFVAKHSNNPNLQFLGKGLFGDAYARFYSESQIGLGLLSKKFPELHTTRLFEIPACGTAMITERNAETTTFFQEDEVIFYNEIKELVDKTQYALANAQYLNSITKRGSEKVMNGKFDYESIISSLLKQTGVIS